MTNGKWHDVLGVLGPLQSEGSEVREKSRHF